MKILILDDYGAILFEQNNPGYLHFPIIMDGKQDIDCEDDDCQDPRCLERREESVALVQQWFDNGEELAFLYHLGANREDTDVEELQRLPNHRIPAKVKLQSYTHNEIVLSSG